MLACADTEMSDDIAFSDGQFQAYDEVCRALTEKGLDIGLRHCASTGGLLCHPTFRMDMVRVGMLPLGQSIGEESAVQLGLEPIMNWYAKVIDIHRVLPGESIGYGRMYHALKEERIAVLSVGYADGYSRAFSNRTQVILGGKRAPIRGKPCMDFIMVDVTGIPDVKIGDQALLLGREGEQWISADSLAQKIPYDTNGGITSSITSRVRRIYRYDHKTVAISAVQY